MITKTSTVPCLKKIKFAMMLSIYMLCSSVYADSAIDIKNGEKIFAKCKICHSLEKDVSKMGPSLHNVFGRIAGTLTSYTKYSEGMKSMEVVWDNKTISEFLIAPRTYIKGTKMFFLGLKDEKQRNNLIAYLKSVTKSADGS